MSPYISPPPTNPDIKRELKTQLLAMSARSFESFAGDFLVYIGLEGISVTRYIGDGGIGEKIALSRNNLMLSGTPYDPYLVQMTHILTYQSI